MLTLLPLLMALACAPPPPAEPVAAAEIPPTEAIAAPQPVAAEPPVEATPPADGAVGAQAPDPVPDLPAPPPPAAGSLADGSPCTDAATCASGICEGLGCDEALPGACAPRMRPCTRDLRAFCSCDGLTFRSSSSCVGRRYASAGPCP